MGPARVLLAPGGHHDGALIPTSHNTTHPDSKVHGANMGPTWGRQNSCGPHVGPMNLDIWVAAGWTSSIIWIALFLYTTEHHRQSPCSGQLYTSLSHAVLLLSLKAVCNMSIWIKKMCHQWIHPTWFIVFIECDFLYFVRSLKFLWHVSSVCARVYDWAC